jgi:hypothetical protein
MRKKYGIFYSNHKLKIEPGRYSKPITPLENRICEKCFSDEIESEHLLLKCSCMRKKYGIFYCWTRDSANIED